MEINTCNLHAPHNVQFWVQNGTFTIGGGLITKTPIIIIGLPRAQDVRLVRQLQCVTALCAQDVTLVSNADPATICQRVPILFLQLSAKVSLNIRGLIKIAGRAEAETYSELFNYTCSLCPHPTSPTLGLCLSALLISRSPTLPRTQGILHEVVGSMVENGVASYRSHPSLH